MNTNKDNTTETKQQLTKVQALHNFRLFVAFADGTMGIVNMEEHLAKECGCFVALRDADLFMTVSIENGAVAWPGELYLASEKIHEELLKADIYTVE